MRSVRQARGPDHQPMARIIMLEASTMMIDCVALNCKGRLDLVRLTVHHLVSDEDGGCPCDLFGGGRRCSYWEALGYVKVKPGPKEHLDGATVQSIDELVNLMRDRLKHEGVAVSQIDWAWVRAELDLVAEG